MNSNFESFIRRFHDKYTPEPNSGCWLWEAGVSSIGYGKIGGPKGYPKGMYAHRASWLIHRGYLPDSKNVLHKCDNRCCVNPDHLYLGTHEDNMKDMKNKGRANRNSVNVGSENGTSKLSERDVMQIKDLLVNRIPLSKIASRFSCSISTISQIKTGKTWKHVNTMKEKFE